MRADGLSSYWWKKLQKDPDYQIACYFYELDAPRRQVQAICEIIPAFQFLALTTAIAWIVRNSIREMEMKT